MLWSDCCIGSLGCSTVRLSVAKLRITWPKEAVHVMVWGALSPQAPSRFKMFFRSNSNQKTLLNKFPAFSTFTMHRTIIFSLNALAFASPLELVRANAETDLCPKTGSHCKDFDALCCDPVTGDGGKVKFHGCSDGCGSIDGKTQCIDDP